MTQIETIKKIKKYMDFLRKKGHYKIYPQFSVVMDNQYYIGVGESDGRVGRLFPCPELYSFLSSDFLTKKT